jgi:sugar phosphate isomerase/epimerase
MTGSTDIYISSGAFYESPLGDALARVAGLAAGAEICSWARHSLLLRGSAEAVRSCGLPFGVHGPFTRDLLAARSKAKRREGLETHRRHLAVAAELGAAYYVVHPDMSARRFPWDTKAACRLEASFEVLKALQDEFRVDVVVENMPVTGLSHFISPGDLDLKGLSVALDIGHAGNTGTLLAWLTDPVAPLRVVHLHDNGGFENGDPHQPLGTSDLDIAPVLAVARSAGATLVLEHIQEDAVLASLAHLRSRGLLTPPAAARVSPALGRAFVLALRDAGRGATGGMACDETNGGMTLPATGALPADRATEGED